MTPEQYLSHLRSVYEAYGLGFRLQPPASAQALAGLQPVQRPLDPTLAALWRLTQGSDPEGAQPMFQRPGFVDALALLTPAQALQQAARMQERAPRMRELAGPASTDPRLSEAWWEPGWLPFASFYGDIVLLVDASPGPQGLQGQVIAFVHDPDAMHWVAPSFSAYLQASADSIDADPEEFLLEPLDAL